MVLGMYPLQYICYEGSGGFRGLGKMEVGRITRYVVVVVYAQLSRNSSRFPMDGALVGFGQCFFFVANFPSS